MDGMRAYPHGEALSDEGDLMSVKARLRLKGFSANVPGQVHLLGFVDSGRVSINKNPWFVDDNDRSLSSIGAGVSWMDPGNFSVRMYYATKWGSEDALSAPDKSGRFWIQAVKYF